MNKLNKYILLLALGVVALVLFVGFGRGVFGGVITNDAPVRTPSYMTYEFFSSTTPAGVELYATTTTATSTNRIAGYDSAGRYDAGYFVIAGAKKVTLFFGRGGRTGANTGSSDFQIEVSHDGTTWYDWNKLLQNVATSTNQWQIATTTISAATSTLIFDMSISNTALYAIRCIVTETTDGEHSCRAAAEW